MERAVRATRQHDGPVRLSLLLTPACRRRHASAAADAHCVRLYPLSSPLLHAAWRLAEAAVAASLLPQPRIAAAAPAYRRCVHTRYCRVCPPLHVCVRIKLACEPFAWLGVHACSLCQLEGGLKRPMSRPLCPLSPGPRTHERSVSLMRCPYTLVRCRFSVLQSRCAHAGATRRACVSSTHTVRAAARSLAPRALSLRTPPARGVSTARVF